MTDTPAPDRGIQSEPASILPSSAATQADAPISESIPLPPMPPLPPAPPPVVGWGKFDLFLLLLLATLALFLGSYSANNSDFWMHMATGRDLANGSHQFGVDPYSFATAPNGTPVRWVNHSWLYDIGLYHLYQAVGGQGVAIVHAVLNVVLLLTLVTFCAPQSNRSAVLLMAALILLVVSTRMPLNSVLVSYLLLGVMLYLLRRGGALGGLSSEAPPSSRALWALPVLFLVWVNLDGWFILGLAALMLLVAGNAVAAFLGRRSGPEIRRQALVLLACILATLANPFHIHAWTLPPELAYALGNWLPASLGAGGDTLRELAKYDPESFRGSGFSSVLQAPFNPFRAQGLAAADRITADRVATFVLVLLAIASAPLVIVASTSENGLPLPLGRLAVLLVITVLGFQQVRLLPLFAVLAGVMAMMNFAEFAQWLRRRPERDPHGGFNPNLARLATLVLLVVGLILAWPGWLHVRLMTLNSYRRVAWEVFEDPSLRSAAESLQTSAKRVFNYSPELANYCAWFAPDVRCYVDQRYSLFAHEAARYGKAKRDMLEDAANAIDPNAKAPRGEWLAVFRDHHIDHLGLTRYSDALAPTAIVSFLWFDDRHWTQQFTDGYSVVFRRFPGGDADPMALVNSMGRDAFGPEARRAPRESDKFMAQVPSLQSLYLEDFSPQPRRPSGAASMYLQYFQVMSRRLARTYEPTWLVSLWSVPAGLSGAAPGSVLWCSASRMTVSNLRSPDVRRDFGPRAAPLLMIRQARRAVQEQPQEALSFRTLYTAFKLQTDEIESPLSAGDSKTDRTFIRHIQLVSALRSYLELEPDDWQLRMEFSRLLYQERLLDAGLEQLKTALKSLEKIRRATRDPRVLEALQAEEKNAVDFYKFVDREVRRRQNDFDIQSSKRKPIEKFELAVLARYKSVNQLNQDVFESTGMGLPLEGLKQLDSIASGSLTAQEQQFADYHRFRVYLLLGQLGEANLAASALQPGPNADQLILWWAAAAGDYELADEMLGRLETGRGPAPTLDKARGKLAAVIAAHFAGIRIAGEFPAAVRAFLVNFSDTPVQLSVNEYLASAQSASVHCNLSGVRGLLALEAGDTLRAERHLAEAVNSALPEFQFADRRLAERYLALIRAYRK